MKILHTIETRGPGGAEILLINIANQLSERGYENFGLFIKEGWILNKFRSLGYVSKYLKLVRTFDVVFLLKFCYFVISNQIRVIHAHEFTMAFYSTVLAFFVPKLTVVCTFHGRHYHSDTAIRQRAMRFIAKNSKLVTVSNDVAIYIANLCKINPNSILVIENGIPLPAMNIPGDLKKELDLNDNSVLIGSVGRLHKVKGHIYFLEAAEIILKTHNNVHFVIAGGGAEQKNLENTIVEKKISDFFTLLGERSDIDNILNSLDIFVLPSLSEGTSLALLEAMAHSLPIVATNVGNNVKIVSALGNVLVNPQNATELASGIGSVIDLLNKSFSFEHNREKIEKNYSLDAMVNEYLVVYEEST